MFDRCCCSWVVFILRWESTENTRLNEKRKQNLCSEIYICIHKYIILWIYWYMLHRVSSFRMLTIILDSFLMDCDQRWAKALSSNWYNVIFICHHKYWAAKWSFHYCNLHELRNGVHVIVVDLKTVCPCSHQMQFKICTTCAHASQYMASQQ